MNDLRELYQEVIIDHGRHPRNFGPLPSANYTKEGFNPLCGDKINLYIEKCDGILKNIRFEGCGCAISMASASLMSEILKEKTIEEANTLFVTFHHMVTEGPHGPDLMEKMGKLAVLGNVSAFPARVKCATLAWHTLHAALTHDEKPVSTE
jgi:nitrogen fixation protein NifU and related proteins